MEISLQLLGGKHAGQRIPLARSMFLIGRHARCHLRPASPEVSTLHCMLFVEKDRVVVHDLKSRTGTLVNELVIRGEMELGRGDRLRVGPLTFVVAAEEEALAAAASAEECEEAAAAVLLADPEEGAPSAGPCEPTGAGTDPPCPAGPLLSSVSDKGALSEAEQCDFANYEEPTRKLHRPPCRRSPEGDPGTAATRILKERWYRSKRRQP